ncbi:myeloid differentiation primary response protein MyD88-like [Clavelina lepadiformis]|uniref:myeloid differentiation primary response protein MyD88-like n=1 Tax=Clavelina lepadiformis TaxID=159417 RepID=UPI004041FB00
MDSVDSDDLYRSHDRNEKQELQMALGPSPAIKDQEEELDLYRSGLEKKSLPESVTVGACDSSQDTPGTSFFGSILPRTPVQASDTGKEPPSPDSTSLNGSSSYLQSPPPAYYGEPMSGPISSSKDVLNQPNNVASFEPSRGSYLNMLIKDLRYETRRQLGLRLDLELTSSPNWKSVADIIGFSNLEIQNFASERLKTERVLNEAQVKFPRLSVGHLCDILQSLERHDIVTDLEPYFERDAKFLTNPMSMSLPWTSTPAEPQRRSFETASLHQEKPSSSSDVSYKHASKSWDPQPPPTMKDYSQPTTTPELPSTKFDAFVLYDVADRDFILKEFLPKVENEMGISLFIPDRDLNVGAHSYRDTLEAMVDRCPKLVVILSDEFLNSQSSQWALNMGVAIDPAARQQKVIPVIYKRITAKTNILSALSACDRTRVLEDQWFWDSLQRTLTQSRPR